MIHGRLDVWLLRAWWVLFPSVGALAVALLVERACGRGHQLLPGLMSRPMLAWPVAVIYLGAYAWILTAYVITVQRTEVLIPRLRELRGAWPHHIVRLYLMALLIAIDSLPVSLWRLVGHVVCDRM